MLAAYPFPYYFPRPVDLDDGIVQQALVGHFGIGQVFVTQKNGIPFGNLGFQPRRMISYRISFPLIIMMNSGHPLRLLTRVFNVFVLIELPYHIAIPVYLNQIGLVLHSISIVAQTQMPHHIAAWQNLIRKSM